MCSRRMIYRIIRTRYNTADTGSSLISLVHFPVGIIGLGSLFFRFDASIHDETGAMRKKDIGTLSTW